VLVPEHVGGPAGLQRGPDAVGADDVLGVGEPGGQHDAVQVPFQVAVAGEPAQHEPRGVGQDDADRLPAKLLVQPRQDGRRAACQRGLEVGRMQEGQVEAVGRDVPLAGPPPGGKDRLPDDLAVDRLGGEEPVPGHRKAIAGTVQPR
jgi:hypothetical protein